MIKQKNREKKRLKNNPGDNLLSDKRQIIDASASVASRYLILGVNEFPYLYHIDKIVIMPVNTDTSFIYWELTDRLLNSTFQELSVNFANLIIKIFEAEQGRRKEIYSFKVKEKIGKHYLKYHTPCKPLVAGAGIVKKGNFIELLKSKTISTPSFKNTGTEDEIWMKKIKGMFEISRPQKGGITHGITHTVKEKGLLEYYRKNTKLHRDHLSSEQNCTSRKF